MPHAWPPGDDDTDANQDREEDSEQPEFTVEECIEALEEIRKEDPSVKEDTAERLLETSGIDVMYRDRTYKAVDPAGGVSSSSQGDPKRPDKLEKLRFLKQETDYFERAQVNDTPLVSHKDQYELLETAVRNIDTHSVDVNGVEHEQTTFGSILQYLDKEEGREKAKEVAKEGESFSKAGLFGSPNLGSIRVGSRLFDEHLDRYLNNPKEFPPETGEQDRDSWGSGGVNDYDKVEEAVKAEVNFRTDYISSKDSDDTPSDDGSKYLL